MNGYVPIVSLHVIVAVVGIGPIPIVALSARRARFTPPLKTRLFDPLFRTARWSLVAIARQRPKLAQRYSAAGFEALWRAMTHG